MPKNVPEGGEIDWNVVIVYIIEIPIQKPKKQKKSYSGKKKMYTFKVQAMIYYKSQKILSLCSTRSAVHDFELFKRNLSQIPSGALSLQIRAIKGFVWCIPIACCH
nr:transposase family protein [Providencia huaxiensis]